MHRTSAYLSGRWEKTLQNRGCRWLSARPRNAVSLTTISIELWLQRPHYQPNWEGKTSQFAQKDFLHPVLRRWAIFKRAKARLVGPIGGTSEKVLRTCRPRTKSIRLSSWSLGGVAYALPRNGFFLCDSPDLQFTYVEASLWPGQNDELVSPSKSFQSLERFVVSCLVAQHHPNTPAPPRSDDF